ncbi:hypothetical protein JVU11DRAFT_7158 [Chiua virens]|nr:hypothetical protein JVU11DRAFT_7158 [Chiua virens]
MLALSTEFSREYIMMLPELTRRPFIASHPYTGYYCRRRSVSSPPFSSTSGMNLVCHKVLLILRTYAFWQGDRRVLYGLFAYGCVRGLLSWASVEFK